MRTTWWWFWVIVAVIFGSMLVNPAVQESAIRQYGVTRDGVVVDRLSSTGEGRTTKIGLRWDATVRTAQYARFPLRRSTLWFDDFVHLAATGTWHVWVIDYRFNADGRSIFGRSYVDHDFWLATRSGGTVRVLYVPGDIGNNRIVESRRLRDVLVMVLLTLLCLGLAYAPRWIADQRS
jgi:hypothetical protein